MDDRQAQFLILIGDICVAAAAADLSVAVHTREGETAAGVPTATQAAGGEELGDTGYDRILHFDGQEIPLDQVVSCTVRAP